MSLCPCGTDKEYSACCESYIEGQQNAPGAEALLRSRYSAFVKNRMSYIFDTHDPETIEELNKEETKLWAEESEWHGLKILEVESFADEGEASVEFQVDYTQNGKRERHHELSHFVKRDGRWYFSDGELVKSPFQRLEKKVGRNDPCSCGSGKKYKRCCAN